MSDKKKGLAAATMEEIRKTFERVDALVGRARAKQEAGQTGKAGGRKFTASHDTLARMGYLQRPSMEAQLVALQILHDPQSALYQWSQIYRNQAAVDAQLEVEMMPAIDPADLAELEAVAAEWNATQEAIDQTRAALEAHQAKAPKTSEHVPAWSAKRGELQSALDSYTAIAAAHQQRYYGVSWKVGQALRAYAKKEFAAAEKELEAADARYRELMEQARESRRPAVARVEGLRRLLQRIDAGTIDLFK